MPLRGGSKSIIKKNIKLLAGKPLCAWGLEASYNSKIFDKIIVSTDCNEIACIVKNLNLGIQIIKRPDELATDTASTEAVMLHVANLVDFNVMVTIQATSPLVKTEDFINAHQLFTTGNFDSLVTGVRTKRFFWEKSGKAINYNPLKRPRRQDMEGWIMENGAFYFTKKDILEQNQCRLGGEIGVYEMSEDTAIEIDEPDDWFLIENLIKRREKK